MGTLNFSTLFIHEIWMKLLQNAATGSWVPSWAINCSWYQPVAHARGISLTGIATMLYESPRIRVFSVLYVSYGNLAFLPGSFRLLVATGHGHVAPQHERRGCWPRRRWETYGRWHNKEMHPQLMTLYGVTRRRENPRKIFSKHNLRRLTQHVIILIA